VIALIGCGSREPSASNVAQAASATSCERSNYGLVLRLQGGKQLRPSHYEGCHRFTQAAQ